MDRRHWRANGLVLGGTQSAHDGEAARRVPWRAALVGAVWSVVVDEEGTEGELLCLHVWLSAARLLTVTVEIAGSKPIASAISALTPCIPSNRSRDQSGRSALPG